MKTLWIAPLLVVLFGCGTANHQSATPSKLKLITAARDISAGTVIQQTDLTVTNRELDDADANETEDPALVIGHPARFAIKKGEIISLYKISP
jgi:flagella basal body P-ring formation protein FlgA